jgi:hypothetical protein
MAFELAVILVVVAAAVAVALLLGRRRRAGRVHRSVTLTAHARERMAQREVTVAQIETVVGRPERVVGIAEESSVRLERSIDGRVLKVWVPEPWPAPEAVIKTVAWADPSVTIAVPPRAVGRIIGQQGRMIRSIEVATGTRIRHERGTATFTISGPDRASIDEARREIRSIVRR